MNVLSMGMRLAIVFVTSLVGSNLARTEILLTVDEMRQVGVALRILDPESGPFHEKSAGFPNKCYYDDQYELSISDEMLGHFKKRDFTLATVCLAIQGYSRFDVEVGNRLPLAVPAFVRDGKKVAIWQGRGILLNVPDCYKAGIPILDCRSKYDFVFGRIRDTTAEIRKYDVEEHKKMSVAALKGYKTQCSCAEIQFSAKDQFRRAGELILPGTCRVDTLPACAANKVQDQTAVGTLVTEDYLSFRDAAEVFGSQHTNYDISPTLPHGYGYMISGPEGDDPKLETVDLSTASKQTGTAAPWLPRR